MPEGEHSKLSLTLSQTPLFDFANPLRSGATPLYGLSVIMLPGPQLLLLLVHQVEIIRKMRG